jgi:hypothetical protein
MVSQGLKKFAEFYFEYFDCFYYFGFLLKVKKLLRFEKPWNFANLCCFGSLGDRLKIKFWF